MKYLAITAMASAAVAATAFGFQGEWETAFWAGLTFVWSFIAFVNEAI